MIFEFPLLLGCLTVGRERMETTEAHSFYFLRTHNPTQPHRVQLEYSHSPLWLHVYYLEHLSMEPWSSYVFLSSLSYFTVYHGATSLMKEITG